MEKICFDNCHESSKSGDLIVLPCGHKYHKECISNWFSVYPEKSEYSFFCKKCPSEYVFTNNFQTIVRKEPLFDLSWCVQIKNGLVYTYKLSPLILFSIFAVFSFSIIIYSYVWIGKHNKTPSCYRQNEGFACVGFVYSFYLFSMLIIMAGYKIYMFIKFGKQVKENVQIQKQINQDEYEVLEDV